MNYERCSVTFFLFFKSKFPDEYCYWYCYWCSSDVWYKNQTTGVNTINTMLNRMKRVTPLAELCANKNITNHSGKETAVRKLIFLDFQKMWNKKKRKTSQVTALNVKLMHTIAIMNMKCLQCHQQYLNLSALPRQFLKKILSHCHHRNNLNLISPGIFIEDPSTRTIFLSK